jgi:beta-glucuronidase
MSATSKPEPGNIEESMHLRDYFAPYGEKRLEADTLFHAAGRRKASLAGPWRHTVDQYDSCLRSGWHRFTNSRSVYENYKHLAARYGVPSFLQSGLKLMDWLEFARKNTPFDFDFEGWEELELPCCWNLARPEYFWYEGPMVFTRAIEPEARKGERTFLRICGANYRTLVFLNGIHLGTHYGGSGEFVVELTKELFKKGNRLILSVDSTRRSGQVPMGNTDWFNYGGIYRDIELVYLPAVSIKDYFIRLLPDGTMSRIAVDVSIDPPCDGEAIVGIPELGLEQRLTVQAGRGSISFETPFEAWSPSHPRLYEVEIVFNAVASGTVDRIRDRIGFREIVAKGGRVYLNGEDLILKGVCIHEDSAVNGKAVTEAEIRENFALAKELGCNFVRLAHYPHRREAALIADELGLMLWEEIPVYWAIDFANPDTLRDARNQLSELILRDRNRASVVIWSVGNENADWDERLAFMSSLVDTARALDESRLVSAACLCNLDKLIIDDRLAARLDIVGINEYFGWYEPGYDKLGKIVGNSALGKPIIISEFGADARLGRHGSKKEFFTLEKQTEVYEEQVKAIGAIPAIRGASPWVLFDFRSPKRTAPVQGYYNRKGLLDETRRLKKPAFSVMKDFYSRWS